MVRSVDSPEKGQTMKQAVLYIRDQIQYWNREQRFSPQRQVNMTEESPTSLDRDHCHSYAQRREQRTNDDEIHNPDSDVADPSRTQQLACPAQWGNTFK